MLFVENNLFRNTFPDMHILRHQGLERQRGGWNSSCVRCGRFARTWGYACDECAIALYEGGYWDLVPIVNRIRAEAQARNQIHDIGDADVIVLAPFAI